MPSPATIVGISDDTERGKKRSWVPPRGGRLGPLTVVLRAVIRVFLHPRDRRMHLLLP
jgi:hypothetical protein